MRLLKPLIGLIATLMGVLGVAAPALGATAPSVSYTGPVTEIDGRDADHVQFPTSEAAAAFRPRTADQKSLAIENYFIHDLTNQKGLDIRASTRANAAAWAYESITIKNSTFQNIERREDLPGGNGLHIDFIRIAGGGNSQDTKMNVLIENVVIDGGDALPILITDGTYGTVTLRNVSIRNTTLGGVQFKTDKVGSVDKIVIDNSPGLGVALIGRPGSVGEILVRNSPDIRLGDSLNNVGTGATVSFIDSVNAASDAAYVPAAVHLTPAIVGGRGFESSASLPVVNVIPEPGTFSVMGMAAIGLLARRRR
jgi:hypothetical protein